MKTIIKQEGKGGYWLIFIDGQLQHYKALSKQGAQNYARELRRIRTHGYGV